MSFASRGKKSEEYEEIALRHPDHTTPRAVAFPDSENEIKESYSSESRTPLSTRPPIQPLAYTPLGETSPGGASSPQGRQQTYESPYVNKGQVSGDVSGRPTNSRNSSWDVFSGLKRFEQGYEQFDTRNASEVHLQFADGDVPNGKLARLYNYLLNVSVVTRWILFIVPVMALIWIPGILGLTAFPRATIWNVKLLWWSIWLSVVWGGWWAALAAARALPVLVRNTVGVVAVASRRYIAWLVALHRYVALFGWTLAVWISFNPLIDHRSVSTVVSEVSTLAKLLFAFVLCTGILLFEKFSIQWIAGKFHERSYAERIADQKNAVKTMIILYANSSDIPGRSDTLNASHSANKSIVADPRRLFKRALKGVRQAATTTTTALGNVASEIAGSSVLQPNSPQAMVQTALASANKTRLLARRLFYSFRKPGHDYILPQDIARFFPTRDQADDAFMLFDKDGNGDATREEVELACMECHREQLSIEHSMRDLDSAVGRLDNILMSVYVVVALLIIAVSLEAQLTTLITGAGTLVLGLSWLIGDSLSEVLTSIIFLFVKHPYDVGDRVDIEKASYTVKEIRLLSTIFLDKNNCSVQAPNKVLSGQLIQNIRRSPQMSETFQFDVAYSTSFDQIEKLRTKMLAFVESQRRDFLPHFDVVVVDIPGQEKVTLSADIKYKSNWQQGAMKVKRRNKWICALKTSLAELKIFGPTGNPDAKAAMKVYSEMPWEEFKFNEKTQMPVPQHNMETTIPRTDYAFSDKNAELVDDSQDVFGESEQLSMPNPIQSRGPATPEQTYASNSVEGLPIQPRSLPEVAYEMSERA